MMRDFEDIAYRDGTRDLTGKLCRPDGRPRAAVAVFPTVHNFTPRVSEKASALCDAGYLVMVTDHYGEQVSETNPGPPLGEKLRADTFRFRARLRAGLEALRAEAPGIPMLAIGFCMGGQSVLELARDGAELAAVVSFHGLLQTHKPAVPGTIKSRILVCHGDKDPLVPREQVMRFMEEMDRAGADWHLHTYSSAVHGFTDPANDEKPLASVAFDPSADRQSWAATLEFFNEVLCQASHQSPAKT